MTANQSVAGNRTRTAIPRRFPMCPPRHVDVTHSAGPWPNPGGAPESFGLPVTGLRPIGADHTEPLKAGGSAKCCTPELRG
jgi:hypothetical protein